MTPSEMARALRISPKTLRARLRRMKTAGDPRLKGHLHNERWLFDAELAHELMNGFQRRVGDTLAVRAADSAGSAKPSTSTDAVHEHPRGHGHRVRQTWIGVECDTLEDLLRPGLLAVCVGINPTPASVAAGHYYQGEYGQRFFDRLRRVELLLDGVRGREDDAAFASGVGFTDLVKRPTRGESDLTREERQYGRSILEAKIAAADPDLVIFAFKSAAVTLLGPFEHHGFIGRQIAGADVFVMPGPTAKPEIVEAALAPLTERVALLRVVRDLP